MGMEIKYRENQEWIKPIKMVTPLKKKTQNSKRAEKILKNVINRAQNSIYGLSYGLSVFELVPVKEKTKLASDGKHLFYQPAYVLSLYNMGEIYELKRQLIHLTLHGLLGHYDKDEVYHRRVIAWDVMDRQVKQLENLLEKTGKSQSCTYQDTETYGYDMGLYYQAKNNRKIADCLRKNRGCYYVDNHYLWHSKQTQKLLNGAGGNGEGKNGEDKNGEGNAGGQGQSSWETARRLLFQNNVKDINSLADALKSEGGYQEKQTYGYAGGGDSCKVKKSDKEGNDYTDVLREFFSISEVVKEQVDTIDPMLYHYGLQLYSNVPIIEPLEVTDQKVLHTIVIAIDTSCSCAGYIAEQFLKETCNLLRDIVSTGHIERVYIVQCDAVIQQVDVFENVEDIERFCVETDSWTMKGYGGTSFCPVFEKVNALMEEGEDIECLIYLSDGIGDFPEEAPCYPSFMAITKEDWEFREQMADYGCSSIPDWIRLVKLD